MRVWGSELGECTVEAVQALGAGLHVFLRPLPDGRRTDLKIAQGRGLRVDARSAEFAWARYVQWGRARVPKLESTTPVRLEVVG